MPGFNIPLDNYSRDNCSPQDNRVRSTTIAANATGLRPSNTVEIARNHRFSIRITIPGQDPDDLFWQGYVKKCQRPNPEFDVITIHQGGEEIYKPGKMRWNPIDITFYEGFRDLGGSSSGGSGLAAPLMADNVAEKVYYWWANKILAASNHYKQRGLSDSSQLASIEIKILDGEGRSVYRYILYRCFPIKIVPTDFDHSDTNISEYTVTVRYDYAVELEALDW